MDSNVLQVEETYILGPEDTLKIETIHNITKIIINGKKIDYVSEIKFLHKTSRFAKVKIKRCFVQDDFKKIEPIFREEN